jgi:hypothetical protein
MGENYLLFILCFEGTAPLLLNFSKNLGFFRELSIPFKDLPIVVELS